MSSRRLTFSHQSISVSRAFWRPNGSVLFTPSLLHTPRAAGRILCLLFLGVFRVFSSLFASRFLLQSLLRARDTLYWRDRKLDVRLRLLPYSVHLPHEAIFFAPRYSPLVPAGHFCSCGRANMISSFSSICGFLPRGYPVLLASRNF